MSEIAQFLNFANQLADQARQVTLPYFRKGVSIINKDDASPVTVADRECEQAMRKMLAARYPQHGVFGEEFGGCDSGGWVWVLDPIDGTRSFISGSRQYCTLIALAHDGAPVIGLVDVPALDERWLGCITPQQQSVTFNGEPCRVSAQTELSAAVTATTTLGVADDEHDARLRKLCRQAGHVRLGGDASAFGGLAAGFLDMAADYQMACYDYLPLVPVIRAAGGVISDWTNGELRLGDGKTAVLAAATPQLHQQALVALGAPA